MRLVVVSVYSVVYCVVCDCALCVVVLCVVVLCVVTCYEVEDDELRLVGAQWHLRELHEAVLREHVVLGARRVAPDGSYVTMATNTKKNEIETAIFLDGKRHTNRQ